MLYYNSLKITLCLVHTFRELFIYIYLLTAIALLTITVSPTLTFNQCPSALTNNAPTDLLHIMIGQYGQLLLIWVYYYYSFHMIPLHIKGTCLCARGMLGRMPKAILIAQHRQQYGN
jgi:hypothetical protein